MSLLPILSLQVGTCSLRSTKCYLCMVWSLFTTLLVPSLSLSLCRLWPHQTFVYSSSVLNFGLHTSHSWWSAIPASLLPFRSQVHHHLLWKTFSDDLTWSSTSPEYTPRFSALSPWVFLSWIYYHLVYLVFMYLSPWSWATNRGSLYIYRLNEWMKVANSLHIHICGFSLNIQKIIQDLSHEFESCRVSLPQMWVWEHLRFLQPNREAWFLPRNLSYFCP